MNPEILRDCALEISVWDYERNTGSYFLGGVRMNLGSGFYQGKPCDWMAEGWKSGHIENNSWLLIKNW